MEVVFCRWVFSFLIGCWVFISVAFSVESLNGSPKVRGVNLGGWLVVEGWIKPSLFDGIPNGDMIDGTQLHFKSVVFQKYVSAVNGGGAEVTVDRDVPSWWETFRELSCRILLNRHRSCFESTDSDSHSPSSFLHIYTGLHFERDFPVPEPEFVAASLHVFLQLWVWRVSATEFQFRSNAGQFLTSDGGGGSVSATAQSPSTKETFFIERFHNRVHIKLLNGSYVQAASENELTADYLGVPGWDDNAATFELTIVTNILHGDYQLANGYGHDIAKEVLRKHRSSFVTREDFRFLFEHGINTVRIPVGWWIAHDPNPPFPFIGGSLAALDKAFSWALDFNLRCIIDLHAAPGSQNGVEHSASRDGSIDWPNSSDYISESLDVIDFLASRYAYHPALLGIELLNEPSAAGVPLDVLVTYYLRGYEVVRKYSSTAYVIFCQRIGNADPMELYQANIGSLNTVVDLHYYNLFDSFFNNTRALDNIQFIYKSRQPQVQSLNNANGPLVFIGEWVNEWYVNNGSQAEYQDFGKAQLDVYNAASFGWSYWTLKNARKHWDFEWNILNKFLLLEASSNKQIPSNVLLLMLACGCFYFQHVV